MFSSSPFVSSVQRHFPNTLSSSKFGLYQFANCECERFLLFMADILVFDYSGIEHFKPFFTCSD